MTGPAVESCPLVGRADGVSRHFSANFSLVQPNSGFCWLPRVQMKSKRCCCPAGDCDRALYGWRAATQPAAAPAEQVRGHLIDAGGQDSTALRMALALCVAQYAVPVAAPAQVGGIRVTRSTAGGVTDRSATGTKTLRSAHPGAVVHWLPACCGTPDPLPPLNPTAPHPCS